MQKIAIMLLALLPWGCSEDEYKITYINQDVSGKIGNVEWTYSEGNASIFNELTGALMRVDLLLPQAVPVCEVRMSYPEGNYLSFVVPAFQNKYKASAHEAVIIDLGADVPNQWANKGEIEILSVTDTEITGRVNLRKDSKNYLNGNFTVPLCYY